MSRLKSDYFPDMILALEKEYALKSLDTAIASEPWGPVDNLPVRKQPIRKQPNGKPVTKQPVSNEVANDEPLLVRKQPRRKQPTRKQPVSNEDANNEPQAASKQPMRKQPTKKQPVSEEVANDEPQVVIKQPMRKQPIRKRRPVSNEVVNDEPQVVRKQPIRKGRVTKESVTRKRVIDETATDEVVTMEGATKRRDTKERGSGSQEMVIWASDSSSATLGDFITDFEHSKCCLHYIPIVEGSHKTAQFKEKSKRRWIYGNHGKPQPPRKGLSVIQSNGSEGDTIMTPSKVHSWLVGKIKDYLRHVIGKAVPTDDIFEMVDDIHLVTRYGLTTPQLVHFTYITYGYDPHASNFYPEQPKERSYKRVFGYKQ
ncbi:hypothetical protein DFH27DRAFT_523755 [Peziza echinospora]|nr:hypothetical protein DFH27DRAFT_523755 [Peziza echinospora]